MAPSLSVVKIPDIEKYHPSQKRIIWLKGRVPNKEEFQHVYESMKLNEVREYYQINLDDIYILMSLYNIPYKQGPSAKATHTRRTHEVSRRDFGETPAPAPAQQTNAQQSEIDYKRLAHEIVLEIARLVMEGNLARDKGKSNLWT